MSGEVPVSVVIVSDYTPSAAKEATYLEACLAGLAAQVDAGEVEWILVLTTDVGSAPPGLPPAVQLLHAPGATSFQAKNVGAEAARHPILAFTDADCVPTPQWLQQIRRAMREMPEVAAISGKTVYAEQEFLPRACCLIGRAYIDPGEVSAAQDIANHNFAIRREAYRSCPLPNEATPFGGTLYGARLRAAGHAIVFDPAVLTYHVYDGWAAECDIRRNRGYAAVHHRRHHPEVPQAWLGRLGLLGVPPLWLGSLLQSCFTCLRRASDYGVRAYELPGVLCVAFVLYAHDLTGMLDAVRGRPLRDTVYH